MVLDDVEDKEDVEWGGRKVTAEMERFLPAGYLSMAYGEKDTMFKEAFSKMAASFQIQYPTENNIAEESFAVQTLYNR